MRIGWALALASCSGADSRESSAPSGGDDSDTPIETDPCIDICSEYGVLIPKAVDTIIRTAAADPEFEIFFAPLMKESDEEIGNFELQFANFMGAELGCPVPSYQGPPMAQAHAGMNLTRQHYDDFVAIIASVLAKAGVAQADVEDCFVPPLTDPTLVRSIIGH